MRVIFMGTPDFAVPSLQALLTRHEVVAVVKYSALLCCIRFCEAAS